MRESVRINTEGFWIFLEEFAVGKSEAELLARCERYFVEQGCGRLTMDMVLVGEGGDAEPEFRIASPERRIRAGDLVLPSLEIAGPGGHWVEVSRAIRRRRARRRGHAPCWRRTRSTSRWPARPMRPGAVGTRGAPGARSHGASPSAATSSATSTGHSIGMTMIEFPKIGEGVETELAENMVFSMHPHAIASDGKAVPLHAGHVARDVRGRRSALRGLPMRIFQGGESRYGLRTPRSRRRRPRLRGVARGARRA